MSLTNKVLYDIDQRNDTTPTQKETARKNIGAYEDKTATGGGTGLILAIFQTSNTLGGHSLLNYKSVENYFNV